MYAVCMLYVYRLINSLSKIFKMSEQQAISDMECHPLKTLEEVKNWSDEGIPNKMKQATECLRERPHTNETVPKTLVCHDMRGGYLEDRFIQGDKNEKSYNFYHWQLIDSFVYFSHNFITIPPVTWINVAHRNGVKMLGTLITEWKDGFKICEEFLASESSYQALADQMVKITQFYRFDGWLINIENKIVEEKVPCLCKFVEYLTAKLHETLPGSEVIWYDSVINTGELTWQDALNDKNCMFFDVCDGIFLNYNWNSEKLLSSMALATSKDRPRDVYVGLDVFGRGCLGGGGFNSIEALTAIRKYNMSVAIFAFGWVYECCDVDNYIDNENRFWDLLSDLCPTTVWTKGLLSSSFCIGAGRKFYLQGNVCNENPWYNLSLQEVQPYYRRKQIVVAPQELPALEPCFECAYLGGSCLSYNGELPSTGIPQLFRLFDLDCKPKESYIVSYAYKTKGDNEVFLEIESQRQNEKKSFIFLSETEQLPSISDSDATNDSIEKKPIQSSKVIINPKPIETVLKECLNQICLPAKDCDWTSRWYILDKEQIEDFSLTSILCGLSSKNTQKEIINIGQIQMFPLSQLRIPSISNIEISTQADSTIEVSWACSNPADVSYYIVYLDNIYLGRAASTYYFLENQKDDKKSFIISVQAVLNIGLVTNLAKSEKFNVNI
ncbi:mannosyl-glycoprotein endo-beta-N-acetylglucosaminidase [Mytilus galloprovincialis]|uniref:Cytosolic endo-beta-N-acetylglucosaminidase n=2 Tax=Mytilus galloprovincialis TaxID=29158 RepID=A0A8B6EMZ6_MYTGA|nr:mannosyl-glycoprotein endo-beta-N-acetylglucosaminidase [Mytilus galloprovincialis]